MLIMDNVVLAKIALDEGEQQFLNRQIDGLTSGGRAGKAVGSGMYKIVKPVATGAFNAAGWLADKAGQTIVNHPVRSFVGGLGAIGTAMSIGDSINKVQDSIESVPQRYF